MTCCGRRRSRGMPNQRKYVNCARNEEEQNLVAFQYRGSILYRCFKPILPGRELLVRYGEEYAKDLGITFDYLWSNKCSAKGRELLVRYGEEYAKDLGITFDYLWSNKCSAKGACMCLY
ncbi:hypothetical protein AAFF_G00363130 [Aldrovandia affinis]|uniref:SET domain-containing protein n=1 Tax=Aldrovandia affinis TaxID=143900 RepID=A0AAD7VYN7_9TELE|nr:hypothetical protein AAFF_G00363130 [Aldrovandia affinis]